MAFAMIVSPPCFTAGSEIDEELWIDEVRASFCVSSDRRKEEIDLGRLSIGAKFSSGAENLPLEPPVSGV